MQRSEERPDARSGDGAEQLVGRIADGERDAEARLVERYARGVRIVLHRHTRGGVRGADLVEDLFQETFRLAVEKLRGGELRDATKVGAFLSSIAKNLAIEHYRKAARRQTEVDSETVESARAAQHTVSARPGTSQLAEVLRSEEAHLVRRTIGELSTERDREILFRFYIAEEEKESIAADLGLDSLQFNRVLHRARTRYRDLYRERARALGLADSLVAAVVVPAALALSLLAARGAIAVALASPKL